MLIDGMSADYLILADPEPWMPVAEHRTPNVPTEQSKIILDEHRRPVVVMEYAAYDRWQSQHTFEEHDEQFRQMWQAVRKFDAAALQHLPFLLTTAQFVELRNSGKFNTSYSFHPPDSESSFDDMEPASSKISETYPFEVSEDTLISIEEGFARRFGSALGFAHHVHKAENTPILGELCPIDVIVIDCGIKAAGGIQLHEFSFEVPLTRNLAFAASKVIERWQTEPTSSQPEFGWRTTRQDLTVCVKERYPNLTANDADREEVITRFAEMENNARSDPAGRWLTDYASSSWYAHIPIGESKDYYRGETHGLLFALAIFDMLFSPVSSVTMLILLAALVFMASTSAKRYFGRSSTLSTRDLKRMQDEMYSGLRDQCVELFCIDLAEAARLARAEDERFLISQFLLREKTGSLVIPEPLLPSNDTSDFYRGAVHGLQLGSRILRFFCEKPITDPMPSFAVNLEMATSRLSSLAAKNWLERSSEAQS